MAWNSIPNTCLDRVPRRWRSLITMTLTHRWRGGLTSQCASARYFVRVRFTQSDEFCRGSLESRYAEIPEGRTPKGLIDNSAKFALHSPLITLRFGVIRLTFASEAVGNWYLVTSKSREQQCKTGNNVIRGRKNEKKRGRQPFDRPFELRFGVCFQRKSYGGWGSG
jgi:hypothetical protein